MTASESMPILSGNKPLSNLQLTLLQLYASDIGEEDLKAIQRLIARYFAEKATMLVDEDLKGQGYVAESFLNEHIRTPYKTK